MHYSSTGCSGDKFIACFAYTMPCGYEPVNKLALYRSQIGLLPPTPEDWRAWLAWVGNLTKSLLSGARDMRQAALPTALLARMDILYRGVNSWILHTIVSLQGSVPQGMVTLDREYEGLPTADGIGRESASNVLISGRSSSLMVCTVAKPLGW